MSGATSANDVPTYWYNILGDLPFGLPPDLPAPVNEMTEPVRPQLPFALVRQSVSVARDIEIPADVRERYQTWRPTPLVRAIRLERALGTRARIYYKYEGNNASGSHKLNTALAQAYYYKSANAKRLTTGTGAGQWGTALAIACQAFGMACKVYMVGASFRQKPYRKTIMQLYGAEVVSSPCPDTKAGACMLGEGCADAGNIAFAYTEALEDALANDGTQLCVGSGEAYSILHATVIGLEARTQLSALGEQPDVVLGSLGAGSNFGGIAFPFLADRLRGTSSVRCVSVESSGCPKLTRGVYRYDYTDGSVRASHHFKRCTRWGTRSARPACTQVGWGITPARNWSARSTIIGDRGRGLSPNGHLCERGPIQQYRRDCPRPRSRPCYPWRHPKGHSRERQWRRARVLFCLSGHGLFDMSAYSEYLNGQLQDRTQR